MSLFADATFYSLLLAAYFSAMGLGLNLIFGVMRIVNLAHGSLFMMGSFMAITLYTLYRFNPALALIFIIPAFAFIAIPMYYAFVPKLSKSKDPETASFMLFFGVAYVIQSIAITLFGANYYSVPDSVYGIGSIHIDGYYISASYFIAAAFSISALLFVYFYLYRTRIGLSTRALMDNGEAAKASGVNVTLVSIVAFAISIAIVASSGAFSSQVLFSTSQSIGDLITVTSFSIIIIGGLGNPLATIAGGAVYAFAYEFSSIYLSNWVNVIPFLILIVVIVIRPNGVFGRRLREV